MPTCDILTIRHFAVDVQSDVLQHEAAVLVDDTLSSPRKLVYRYVLPPKQEKKTIQKSLFFKS